METELTPDVQTLVDIIRAEVEHSKIVMYWKVGKHIKLHLLKHGDRAHYGDFLFIQLSKHLSIHTRTLNRCVQFYVNYINFEDTCPELTWSHVRILLTIPDKETRKDYEAKITAGRLKIEAFEELVRKDKGLPPAKLKQGKTTLKVTRDEPYVYRLKEIQSRTMVDLGFRHYTHRPHQTLKPKTVIQAEKAGEEYKLTKQTKGRDPHYTYKAYLVEVVDGDTVWVDIDLGFREWTTQKLRLKGINTAEIEKPEGQSAKDYIVARLKGCKFIAVKTHGRDKFTRFLADIFYDEEESDFRRVIQNGMFLNQELLDEGLAVGY